MLFELVALALLDVTLLEIRSVVLLLTSFTFVGSMEKIVILRILLSVRMPPLVVS